MSNRRRTFLLDPVDASMPSNYEGGQRAKASNARRRRSSALYATPSTSSTSCAAAASSSSNNNNLNSGHPSSGMTPPSPSMLLADPIDYTESQMDPCTVDERAWRAQNSKISTSRTGSKYYRRSKAASKSSASAVSPAMTAPDHTSPRMAHAAPPNSSRPSSPSQFIPTSQYHPPRSVSFNLHQNQSQFYDRNDCSASVVSSSSSSASSSPASTITPRRSPGPWFLAGAPSKLSIRPASTSTRPPLCNDFQLFERLKLSAGLRAYPSYCPHRFLCSGVPTSRIAHHVVGERFWRIAKCCAAALFLGAPPRPTP